MGEDCKFSKILAVIAKRLNAVECELKRLHEQQRRLAFCMGHHDRLGQASPVLSLSSDILSEIVRHVEQV